MMSIGGLMPATTNCWQPASADGRNHYFSDRPERLAAQLAPPRPAAHQRREVVDAPAAGAAEAPPSLLRFAVHLTGGVGVLMVAQRALDDPSPFRDANSREREEVGGRRDPLELVVGHGDAMPRSTIRRNRARLGERRHRPPVASHPGRAIAITELLLDSPPEQPLTARPPSPSADQLPAHVRWARGVGDWGAEGGEGKGASTTSRSRTTARRHAGRSTTRVSRTCARRHGPCCTWRGPSGSRAVPRSRC
jgi:hypothetical protein